MLMRLFFTAREIHIRDSPSRIFKHRCHVCVSWIQQQSADASHQSPRLRGRLLHRQPAPTAGGAQVARQPQVGNVVSEGRCDAAASARDSTGHCGATRRPKENRQPGLLVCADAQLSLCIRAPSRAAVGAHFGAHFCTERPARSAEHGELGVRHGRRPARLR